MKRLLNAIDTVSWVAGVIGGVCLFTMSLLMVTEVFCRNFLNFSLLFSWEYSAYLMASVFFLTAAFTLLVKGHVRVFLLAETLPANVRHVLEVIATLMGLFIAGYVTYALGDFTYQSFDRGART